MAARTGKKGVHMLDSIDVKTDRAIKLSEFLGSMDFTVEELENGVSQVTREGELPVFLKVEGPTLYFEVDLGNISEWGSEELYFQLLDLNTEILPVSIGVDRTNPEDPRLVLVESRESRNLDDNELLSVFNAMELATDKVESLLSKHIS